jgi:omega-hydroxy-beta-dihydromenaquinone-9 sulfotransferase
MTSASIRTRTKWVRRAPEHHERVHPIRPNDWDNAGNQGAAPAPPRRDDPGAPDLERTRPGLLHPLCGTDLSTLTAALARNGPINPTRLPQVLICIAAALCRWPCSIVERAWVAARLRTQPPMPAPLFIVGHWRSGTTHLQNVLNCSPIFGSVSPVAVGLPWDMLGLGTLLRPLLEQALPPYRFVDRVAVGLDSPQEDEIALANMQPLSYYHAVYFPRCFSEHFRRGLLLEGCSPAELELWCRRHRYFLAKVSLDQGGRRLLVKNPVYTSRVSLLRAIWPDAQFVHIHRDPRRVFVSTVHYFRTLLARLALQDYDHVDVEQLVLESYPQIMNALLEQTVSLPEGRFVEVAFEEFERDPINQLERIHERLGLPELKAARPRFEEYLRRVRGYAKNRYSPSPESIRRVERCWASFIARWGHPAGGFSN